MFSIPFKCNITRAKEWGNAKALGLRRIHVLIHTGVAYVMGAVFDASMVVDGLVGLGRVEDEITGVSGLASNAVWITC